MIHIETGMTMKRTKDDKEEQRKDHSGGNSFRWEFRFRILELLNFFFCIFAKNKENIFFSSLKYTSIPAFIDNFNPEPSSAFIKPRPGLKIYPKKPSKNVNLFYFNSQKHKGFWLIS